MTDRFVLLDAVDLTYRAGEDEGTLALEGAGLGIGRGDFAAIVGPSGCGKSTILKLVSGLLAPDRGRVEVGGRAVAGPVKMAGMAFQNPTLLPWLSAIDNVLVPLKIVQPYRSQFKQKRPEYEERARELFRTVGLSGFEKRFPWQLSGGMQQRASLCRALIHEPALLMLDEPFAALDAFTREELWCALRDLQAARKVTVMLVTHDLREAVFLADTVYVMSSRPGRIVRHCAVDLPRPRELEVLYTQRFQDIVHELRALIGKH